MKGIKIKVLSVALAPLIGLISLAIIGWFALSSVEKNLNILLNQHLLV